MGRVRAKLFAVVANVVVLAVAVSPGIASACSVCYSAKNRDNQIAYLATTGFLTFLPLILVGGLLLWIRKRARDLDQDAPTVEAGTASLHAIDRDQP